MEPRHKVYSVPLISDWCCLSARSGRPDLNFIQICMQRNKDGKWDGAGRIFHSRKPNNRETSDKNPGCGRGRWWSVVSCNPRRVISKHGRQERRHLRPRSGGRLTKKKKAILTHEESSVCQNKPSLWRGNHRDRRGDSSVFSPGCLPEGRPCVFFFFIYYYYFEATFWFPRKAINCPRQFEKVLQWKGWTAFNLPASLKKPRQSTSGLGEYSKSHVTSRPTRWKPLPPPCIFIYTARVAAQEDKHI